MARPYGTRSIHCNLAALLVFISSSLSQLNCASTKAQPVVIPIRNVTLQNVTMRATALSFGTPAQDIGFDVAPYVKNIFMFAAGVNCNDNSAEIRCVAAVLGAYDYNTSASWKSSGLSADFAPETANDTGLLSGAVIDLGNDLLGSDILHLNQSTSLNDFPLDIMRASASKRNMLGVGPNSTLLSHLKSSGLIGSNVWSLFYGLFGIEDIDNMDGSLVLGGYDSAKVTGSNSTEAISVDQGCITNLMITVSNILMDVDGQSTSISGGVDGSVLKMCIDPSFRLVSLPLPMWTNFEQNAGGTQVDFIDDIAIGGKPYLADGVYKGNLTFVLSSGLSISIANHQLVLPNRFIGQDGSLTSNATARQIAIQSLENSNANDMPLLGQPFLSAAYLMVDNDQSSFALWQSNPTTDTQLITYPGCQSQGIASHKSDTGLSKGAIAGIVVGAILAIACVAFFIWFNIKRRRSRTHPSAELAAGSMNRFAQSSSGVYEMHYHEPPELDQFSKAKLLPPEPPKEIIGGELPATPPNENDQMIEPALSSAGSIGLPKIQ